MQVQRVPVDKLNVRAPKVEEVNSFEASLRVDALASAGTLGLCEASFLIADVCMGLSTTVKCGGLHTCMLC